MTYALWTLLCRLFRNESWKGRTMASWQRAKKDMGEFRWVHGRTRWERV